MIGDSAESAVPSRWATRGTHGLDGADFGEAAREKTCLAQGDSRTLARNGKKAYVAVNLRRRCQKTLTIRNCLVTNAARLPARRSRKKGKFELASAERFFWTKLAT